MAEQSNAQSFPRQNFAKGQAIFRQGDRGDHAYVVESGAIEIARLSGGVRKVLNTIGDGGIFGAMALIDGKPRMAEAVTLKDTTCMVIGRAKFQEKLVKADPFLRALLRVFIQSVRSLAEKD